MRGCAAARLRGCAAARAGRLAGRPAGPPARSAAQPLRTLAARRPLPPGPSQSKTQVQSAPMGRHNYTLNINIHMDLARRTYSSVHVLISKGGRLLAARGLRAHVLQPARLGRASRPWETRNRAADRSAFERATSHPQGVAALRSGRAEASWLLALGQEGRAASPAGSVSRASPRPGAKAVASEPSVVRLGTAEARVRSATRFQAPKWDCA